MRWTSRLPLPLQVLLNPTEFEREAGRGLCKKWKVRLTAGGVRWHAAAVGLRKLLIGENTTCAQTTIKIWNPKQGKAVMSLGAWATKHGLELPGYVRHAADEEEIQARHEQHARCAGPLISSLAAAAPSSQQRLQAGAPPAKASKRAHCESELQVLLPAQLQPEELRSPQVGVGPTAPMPSPVSQVSVTSLGASVLNSQQYGEASEDLQPPPVPLPDGFAQLDSGVLVKLESLFNAVFSLGGCQEVGCRAH